MSTIDEIEERLNHTEDCCDHSGADEHGCWDCYNTGHAHAPYSVSGEAREDLAVLVAYAKAANSLLAELLGIYVDGTQFDYTDPSITPLAIAQKRGAALEASSDKILDFTDLPVSRGLGLEEI